MQHGDAYGRVMRKLGALQDEPRPAGVENLAGVGDLYRVRVGDYRIVYAIRSESSLGAVNAMR